MDAQLGTAQASIPQVRALASRQGFPPIFVEDFDHYQRFEGLVQFRVTCAKLTFDTDDLAEGMAALTGLTLSGQPATLRMAQSVESGASREVSIMPSQYKEVQGRMVRMEQKRLFLEDPMTVISERAEQVQQPH